MTRDGRTFWLMVILAGWGLAWGASVVGYAGPAGARAFLGWQAVAAMLALPAWRLGRDWPKGGTIRRMAALPGALALAVGLGAAVWGLR